jgi:hypothetical protein
VSDDACLGFRQDRHNSGTVEMGPVDSMDGSGLADSDKVAVDPVLHPLSNH